MEDDSKIEITPLGAQHTSRRDLVVRYADRTLYGTDLALWSGRPVDHSWNGEMYAKQGKYFGTRDPNAYSEAGLELPEDVLGKIYFETARRVWKL